MSFNYRLHDPSGVFSPALLFYKEQIRHNLNHMLAMVGGEAGRLRPHVKTHKTREITRLQLEAGIAKFKCATIAEVEMVAGCGVNDILLAYPMVGPNCQRLARLAKAFPTCRLGVLADHPAAIAPLAAAMAAVGQKVEVLVDLDLGQHRTGIAPGPEAAALYQTIAQAASLVPGGLHVYDGHNHQEDPRERMAAVDRGLEAVLQLRHTLEQKGLPVPRLVLGGTPTFPMYARKDFPGLECSPGTCVLHDTNYGNKFQDLAGFVHAALILTRVISRPTPQRVTFDLGYKAVASDPPAGKRLTLLDVPEANAVLQNEEHLVVETPAANRFQPGDVAYAIPTHICPTSALYKEAQVIEQGRVVGQWAIVGRDRSLAF